ncbi:MAG: hypothetical protein DRI57_29675, partial [Deltaproteobacteria bacterium]
CDPVRIRIIAQILSQCLWRKNDAITARGKSLSSLCSLGTGKFGENTLKKRVQRFRQTKKAGCDKNTATSGFWE